MAAQDGLQIFENGLFEPGRKTRTTTRRAIFSKASSSGRRAVVGSCGCRRRGISALSQTFVSSWM